MTTNKQFQTLLQAPFVKHPLGWWESVIIGGQRVYSNEHIKQLTKLGLLRNDGKVVRITERGLDYACNVLNNG